MCRLIGRGAMKNVPRERVDLIGRGLVIGGWGKDRFVRKRSYGLRERSTATVVTAQNRGLFLEIMKHACVADPGQSYFYDIKFRPREEVDLICDENR